MVTKYDVFEAVYKNRNPIKPIEVVKKFGKNKSHYNIVHRFLVQLTEEDLLIKVEEGFQGRVSPKATQLFRIIYFCVENNLNYNLLLDEKLVSLLDIALSKGEIGLKSSKLNSRTLNKHIDFLSKNGLMLIISLKPLKVKVFYNSLVKNLLTYFGFRPKIKKVKIDYVDKIDKELKKFRRLRARNEGGYKKILDDLEIFFIHHSLSLEGNPITLPDTFKILKHNIIPKNLKGEHVDEIKNYQRSIQQMVEDSLAGEQLTLQTVLRYHETAMAHRPNIAGRIRNYEVHIRGNPKFKVSKYSQVKTQLDQLFNEYKQFIVKKNKLHEIIKFAAYFHNEFQFIHPFGDGNSRTTRLLMFHILQSQRIPFLDIPLGLLDEYLNNTKNYITRNDENLFEHLQKIILFNLKDVNSKL